MSTEAEYEPGWVGNKAYYLPQLEDDQPFMRTNPDNYRTRFPTIYGHNPDQLCFTGALDFIPYYEIHDDRINVDDPIWGKEAMGNTDGDAILTILAKTDPFRRLMSVEQLTLDARASTIPDTTSFSRWEHVWGSVVLTRKLLRQQGADVTSRDSVVLQLRALLSDVGHTAFSHMGDWIFQGKQGGENLHDKKLKRFIERTGLGDILRDSGFEVDEVVFPPIKDFIENSSPRVNVDRLDYVYREIRRWPYNQMIHKPNLSKMRISEIDGEIIFDDTKTALEFGRAAAILPVLHWQEPVHRLMLELREYQVKQLLIDGGDIGTSGLEFDASPYENMYTVDLGFLNNMITTDRFMSAVEPIVRDTANRSRKIFAYQKSETVREYLRGSKTEFEPMSDMHWDDRPAYPPNIIVQEVPFEDLHENDYAIDFVLEPLKKRFVDPLVGVGLFYGMPLSALDKGFAQLLESQAQEMSKTHYVRLLVNPTTKQVIVNGMKEIDDEWEHIDMVESSSDRSFQNIIRDGGYFGGNGFVQLVWAC